ncbi:glutamine synthetase family protein [Scrofimicrobium sp. R131]|uniref:Glutamine synthetase family protein n=1 Tax=Scrofimicrobium appendicitidis TaxID=3079930 RepID=A0AAU7V8V3_9ACTO
MNPQQEQVLREIAERGVRFVRLWFTDVVGQLKALAIDPAQLEDAFTEGIGFDGSAIEGMTRVYESDMLLIPDASSFQLLPWQRDDDPVGRMFCDVYTPEGQPSRTDPRGVLERTLERAAAQGLRVLVHPEVEFYLLQPPVTPDRIVPVDGASYFDHVAWGDSNDFRRRAVRALEEMNIAVEFSHHEGGPGQNEIDLRAVEALAAADNIITTRTVISEVALQEQMVATFMPKPLIDQPGSGLHLHLSLYEGEENALFSPSGQYHLSTTGRQFIAGLLHHARGISAVVNQHVNSYKRLWGGGEAPSYICWGHNNRSALVRVPHLHPHRPNLARVEYRAADASMNPYLGLAVLIAAGLDGIEQRMELEDETLDDVWTLTDQERRALGIRSLPISLAEALQAMENCELVAKTLGEDVYDYVLRGGESEWRDYRQQITRREYERFLGVR